MNSFLKTSRIYLFPLFILLAVLLAWFISRDEESPQYLFWQNDLFTTEDFRSVFALDDGNIWVAGSQGSLYNSVDNAESWERLRNPDGNALREIFFTSSSAGWFLDDNNGLYATADGGKTWVEELFGYKIDAVPSFHFFNNSNGLIGGSVPVSEVDGRPAPALLSTTDGGRSWKKKNIPLSDILCAYFVDMLSGFISSSAGIAQTIDGGETWKVICRDSTCVFDKMIFLTVDLGWSCGVKSGLFRTLNGGSSWEQDDIARGLKIRDIHFINSLDGWAVGDNGLFLCTNDGGESWNRLETGIVTDFLSVYFISPESGIICGKGGTVIKAEGR